MRKELLFLIIVLTTNFVAASNFGCDDGSRIILDTEEVNEGSVKSISGLGIGVCRAEEFRLKLYADLIIDAKKAVIVNSTLSTSVETLGGSYSVSFSNPEETSATIKVGDTASEIEERDCGTVGSGEVMLIDLYETVNGTAASIIIGSKKSSLTSDQKPAEIVEINSVKYMIELFSGSDDQAAISVGKCETGELIEIENENSGNATMNESSSNNETIQNVTNQTINENNFSSNNSVSESIEECNEIGIVKNKKYCDKNKTFIPQKEIDEQCEQNYECLSDFCDEKCIKRNFLKRIVDWIINLFK